MERRNNALFLVLLVAVGILVVAVLFRGGSGGGAAPVPGPGTAPGSGPGSTPQVATGTVESGDATRRDPAGETVRREVEGGPAPKVERVTLRGRLVAGEGAGAADVEVAWRARSNFDFGVPIDDGRDRGGSTARTDAEGRFAIEIPSARRGSLTIDRAANLLFASADRRRAEVAAYDADADLGDLAVHAAASIVGRVVDEAGQPVPAARVRANPDAFVLWLPGEGQSVDGEGHFELKGLEPGKHNVGAEASGFIPATATVEVQSGAVARDVVLTLDHGASVAGTVLDDRGLPVAGAKVAAFRNRTVGGNVEIQGIDSGAAVETDTNGYFVLSGIEGKTVALRAWATGLAAKSVPDVTVGTGNAQIRLQRLGRITGLLLDTEGLPIEGSRVTARAFGGGRTVLGAGDVAPDFSPPGPDAQTDAEGRFEIDGVRPGTVSLSVSGTKHLPVEGYTVQVMPGATVANVMLRAEVGAGIAALVVDTDGAPVPGATVIVSEPPAPMPAGGPGARRIGIRMNRAVDESGDVRMEAFGEPRELRRGETDAEGRVRVGGLPAGPVQVRAESARHAPSRAAELLVPRRGSVEAVLTLRPAGRVEVRTVSATGEPAPEVPFVIRGPLGAAEADRTVEQGTTDASGVARVGPLLEGRYEAAVRLGPRPTSLGGGMSFMVSGHDGEELQDTRVEFDVAAEDLAELVLTRPILTRVVGTVTGASGPAGGVEVRLREAGAMPFAASFVATAAADGAFHIDDVPAGSYTIEWGKPQQVIPHTDTLDVPAALPELRRDLELRGGTVRVQVQSLVDRSPLARAEVSLRRGDEPQRRARGMVMIQTNVSTDGSGGGGAQSITMGGPPKVRTDDDGVAVIEDVPPGEYALVVEHEKHADARIDEVAVVDGRLTDAGTVDMSGAGGVSGKVTGFPEGTELRMAMIEARRAGTEDDPRRETSMSGAFQIGRLEPGDWELRAQQLGPGANQTGPWRPVTVRAGETAEVDLPLAGG